MDADSLKKRLEKDGAEWDALVAALEAHPEGSLHGTDSDPWASRDVYAHLARWIEHSTSDLQTVLEGGAISPIEGTDDEINARWQEEDSEISLDEARERASRAYGRRIEAMEAVPLERWDQRLEAIAAADGWQHYAGHRRYIERG